MDLGLLGGEKVLGAQGDVARVREAGRRRRLVRMAIVLALLLDYPLARLLGGHPVVWGLPNLNLPPEWQGMVPSLVLVLILGSVLLVPMLLMGRSPHTVYRPSEIPVRLDDVVGLEEEAIEIAALDLRAPPRHGDRREGLVHGLLLHGVAIEDGLHGLAAALEEEARLREGAVPQEHHLEVGGPRDDDGGHQNFLRARRAHRVAGGRAV